MIRQTMPTRTKNNHALRFALAFGTLFSIAAADCIAATVSASYGSIGNVPVDYRATFHLWITPPPSYPPKPSYFDTNDSWAIQPLKKLAVNPSYILYGDFWTDPGIGQGDRVQIKILKQDASGHFTVLVQSTVQYAQ